MRAGLVAGIAEAVADPAVHGIVLICAGRTFIAGADITEFGKPPMEPSFHGDDPGAGGQPKADRRGHPWNSSRGRFGNGPRLSFPGGRPERKTGLPEVKLGILPAPAAPSACRELWALRAPLRW